MNSTRSRRTFLAGMGLASLSGMTGCVDGLGSNRGATDVIIHNEAEVPRTVELMVTQRDSESSNIDTSLDMEPHSTLEINNKVIMGRDYDVKVMYSDDTGQSPYKEKQEWDKAAQSLHILLDDQIVFAVQIG